MENLILHMNSIYLGSKSLDTQLKNFSKIDFRNTPFFRRILQWKESMYFSNQRGKIF